MNYVNKCKKKDMSTPEKTIDVIRSLVNQKNLTDKQKLFAIGIILDKNKEHYIEVLKKRIEILNKLIQQQESINPSSTTDTISKKKKIVVVKKK